MLLGVCFGLAFGGGAVGLRGVRQGGEGGVFRGAQPRHQRLQLVFLLLEVQLHTAACRERREGETWLTFIETSALLFSPLHRHTRICLAE